MLLCLLARALPFGLHFLNRLLKESQRFSCCKGEQTICMCVAYCRTFPLSKAINLVSIDQGCLDRAGYVSRLQRWVTSLFVQTNSDSLPWLIGKKIMQHALWTWLLPVCTFLDRKWTGRYISCCVFQKVLNLKWAPHSYLLAHQVFRQWVGYSFPSFCGEEDRWLRNTPRTLWISW